MELIKTEKGFIDNYITRGIVGELDQVIENIDRLKKNHENRQYKPRILKRLEMCKKNKDKEEREYGNS